MEIERGEEHARFALTRCDGGPAPLAIEQLSVLARPWTGTARPPSPAELARKKGPHLGAGLMRLDPLLLGRLQKVVDHFQKGGKPPRVVLVSGYRPASVGSYHAHGRALDFRLMGVSQEDLVAFCKTLPDTGCGYYPNSSFIHMDVRARGAGHVAWIDGSGPGESPHYVEAWPPPRVLSTATAKAQGKASDPVFSLDQEALEPMADEHPAAPSSGSGG